MKNIFEALRKGEYKLIEPLDTEEEVVFQLIINNSDGGKVCGNRAIAESMGISRSKAKRIRSRLHTKIDIIKPGF